MLKTTTFVIALLLTCSLTFLWNTHEVSAEEKAGESVKSKVKARMEEMQGILQQKYDGLPLIPINTQRDNVSFNSYDLSQSLTEYGGRKIYAFRLTTPKQAGYLGWSFKVPNGAWGWYIAPEKGQMKGFTGMEMRELRSDVAGVGVDGDKFIVQTLSQDRLKPDTNYLIWIGCNKEIDPNVTISLNVFNEPQRFYDEIFPMLFGD